MSDERVTEFDDIARGLASAQYEAVAAKTAVNGAHTSIAVLRERVEGNERDTATFRASIERWMQHLDGSIGDLHQLFRTVIGARPHPLVVGALVSSIVLLALCGVVMAAGIGYAALRLSQQDAVERAGGG